MLNHEDDGCQVSRLQLCVQVGDVLADFLQRNMQQRPVRQQGNSPR
jgi:hypothetical protein